MDVKSIQISSRTFLHLCVYVYPAFSCYGLHCSFCNEKYRKGTVVIISSDSHPFTPSIYTNSSTIKSTPTINSPHRHHHHDESVLSNAFNQQLHVKEVMWLSCTLCLRTSFRCLGHIHTHTHSIATNIADCNSNVARENYRAPLFLFTCQEWVYNSEYATITRNSNPYSTAFWGKGANSNVSLCD